MGVVVLRVPASIQLAVVAHTRRRLRARAVATLDVFSDARTRVYVPLFRELATHLGLGLVPGDPQACAEVVAQAASAKRTAVLAPLPIAGSWDFAVATEFALASSDQARVFVTPNDAPRWDSARVFEIDAVLTASDKVRWLRAIAEEAQDELPTNDVAALEAWWARARRAVPVERALSSVLSIPSSLSTSARELVTCLALAGRSLSPGSLSRLDSKSDGLEGDVQELVALGLVFRHGDLLSLTAASDFGALEAQALESDRSAAANVLVDGGGFEPDPWAYARAAELRIPVDASSGPQGVEAADATFEQALRGCGDETAAAEIASRWFDVVARIGGERGLFLRMKGARRALTMGDAFEAQRWCESAMAVEPESPAVALLMGRTLMQRGDFVSARVSLKKAEGAADSDELRASVASELAELSYVGGDLIAAASYAHRVLELAVTAATRLAGRNTLGKIHLTAARWDCADQHFAEDALTASAAGEPVAELRARLNRGIALMSKGLLDDARATLERVLEDGARWGQDRARAYAFANLGVIAYRQRDYGAALSRWDEAIRFRQTLRGRVATAHTIANLAELRLRLGLVAHAEHAVAFGRRLLLGASVPARAAHYRRVSAQIALARHNTDLARREIEAAQADAELSGDKGVLSAVLFVAARVALEDGDLTRASGAIAEAENLATGAHADAEVAVLRAHELRARGALPGPVLAAAVAALASVRDCGEEDLLAETHLLLATLYREAGDVRNAQAHGARAWAACDQVAAGLPADLRAAFLAKPEVMAVSRLHAALAQQPVELEREPEEEAPRTQRLLPRVEVGLGREIIGTDPEIRNLLVAIGKVARSNSTVLIRGESGTGKELVAEALHRASERATGPLVSVNCAALVETLLLSELFGHEKGAFTGAAARRRGRFEMAEGGTLFLDEIGDISSRTQMALLRVLQEKTFERVGGAHSIRANVRVICATHRDLKAMVERGEFREDLYYRLRGITLDVPPLRARLGDLPRIASHLLARVATERSERPKTLSDETIELLQRHRWPGNIRELENVLRAVSLFADAQVITARDVIDNVDDFRKGTLAESQPPPSRRSGFIDLASPSLPALSFLDGEDDDKTSILPESESGATSIAYAQVRQGAVSLSDMKRQIERDCISRALSETKGNITRAAALLGMKRPRLSQLVKQYGLAASSEGL